MAENYYSYLDALEAPPPGRAIPASGAPPLDSDEEFFRQIAEQATKAQQTEAAPQEPSLGGRILTGVGDVLGAQKHGVDYLTRKAVEGLGGEVNPEDTTGSMLRRAVGLEATPESGYLSRLAGSGLEFATDIATDPLSYETLVLGKLAGAGVKASRVLAGLGEGAETVASLGRAAVPVADIQRAATLGKIAAPIATGAGAAFTGVLGAGAIQGGQQLAHTIQNEGFTPQAAEEALGTGLALGGGLAAGFHTGHTLFKRINPVLKQGLESLVAKGELAPEEAAGTIARAQGVAPPPVEAPPSTPSARVAAEPQPRPAEAAPLPAEPTLPPEGAPISAVEAPSAPVEPLSEPPRVEVAAPPPTEAPGGVEAIVGPLRRQVQVEQHALAVEGAADDVIWAQAKAAGQPVPEDVAARRAERKERAVKLHARLDAINELEMGPKQRAEAERWANLSPEEQAAEHARPVGFHPNTLPEAPSATESPLPVEAPPPVEAAPNPTATVPVETEALNAWAERIEPLKALGYDDADILAFSRESNGLAHTDDILKRGRKAGAGILRTRLGGKAREGPPPTPEDKLMEALQASIKPSAPLEESRRAPLPPGALEGTEPLAEQIVGKGYSGESKSIRQEMAERGTEGRAWLEDQYLKQITYPEKRARIEAKIGGYDTRDIIAELEETQSKRGGQGGPKSIYEPGSPAARLLERYPHRADFIQEKVTRLLAQDSPSAKEVMALPAAERPEAIYRWLAGTSKKAELSAIRDSHGALSLEEAGQQAAEQAGSAFQGGGGHASLTDLPPDLKQRLREFKRANDSYAKDEAGKLTPEGKADLSARIEDLGQRLLAGFYEHPDEAVADLADLSNIATTYAKDFPSRAGTPWAAMQKALQKRLERIPGMEDVGDKSFEGFARKAAVRLGLSVEDWAKARFTQDPDFLKAMGKERAEGRLQGAERNDAFKRWFGGSKVVDETGQPLTVYHGSEIGPTEFDISKQGSRTDSGYLGKGFYFGGKVDANVYGAKGAITPVYLALKNPLELSAKMVGKTETWRGRELDRELNIREALRLPKDVSAEEVTKTAKRAGYDGVIYSDPYGGKEYVAFDPEQIKSATGNRGTFDPTNPDIRFSQRGGGLMEIIGRSEATPLEGHPDLSILNHTEARTPALDAATHAFAQETAEPLQKLYERLRGLTGAQGGTLGGFTSSTAHEGAFTGGKSYLNPSYHFSDALHTAKMYGLEGDAEAVKSIAATRAVATLEHEFLHDLGGHKTEAEFAEALKKLHDATAADPEYAALEKSFRDSISAETVEHFRETTPIFDKLVEEKYGDSTGVGSREGAIQGAPEGSPLAERGAQLRGSEGLPESGEGLGAERGGDLAGGAGRAGALDEGELAASSRHAPEDDGATQRGSGAEASPAGEQAEANPPKESPEAAKLNAARIAGNPVEISAAANDLLHSRLKEAAKPVEGDSKETLHRKLLLKHAADSIPQGKFKESEFVKVMRNVGAPKEAAAGLWEAFKGSTDSPAEFTDLFSKVIKPGGWKNWRTWAALWKAGMLGPTSQVANVGGNTVFQNYRHAEGLTAALIDTMRAGITGKERTRYFTELGAALRGRKRASVEAWPDFIASLKQMASLKGESISQHEKHLGSYEEAALARLQAPQDSKLYEFLTTSFKLMEAADDFAKHKLKWEEFYREAHRDGQKLKLTGDALKKHEISMAEEMNQGILEGEGPLFEKHQKSILRAAEYRMKRDTFQARLGGPNAGWISKGAAAINRTKNDLPILEGFFPFTKMPANATIEALARTPYGFKMVHKAWKRGDFKADPGMLYDELAKPLTGSVIMGGIISQLLLDGHITGQGPQDSKQQAIKRETGWQPYSFKIGDKYISYSRLEPMASILGMAADMGEAIQSGNKTTAQVKLKLALSSIGKNLLNKTFLSQLSGAMQAGADPVRFGEQFAKQLTASLVPNVAGVIPVGSLASALDPTYRKTTVLTAPLAKIPGVSKLLPEQETAFGTPRERTGGEGVIGGLQRLLLPYQISTVRNDVAARVAGELDRLDFPLQPPRPYIEISGRRIELSKEQQKRLAEAQFKAVNHMNRMIQDRTYQGLPDSPEDALPGQKTKEYLLKHLLNRYRDPILAEIKVRAKARIVQSAQAHP